MPTVSQEYLPFVVLAFVLLSIRLDRISIRNFISVTIGAVTVWIISPPHSPWGKTISFIILGLAIAMSPLRSFLVRTVKNMLLNTPQYVPEGPLLTILKDPSDAEVDIVAVHGLGSSVETTWTHKISGSLWLRDFLHLDFPKARVMTFRHNSSWESRALVKDLVDHGRQFLGALEGLRAIDESRDRPLILVGHSFGGLLIEQALVLAKGAAANANTRACHESLTNSLAGVIFLGTPHAGSGYSFWGKLYCLFHYWEGANPLLLGYMDPGSQETTKLEDDFLKYFRDLSFDFHELRSNVIFGIQFEMIVKREAATRRGQEARGLDTDHFGLNKYYDRGDASYIAVKDKMVEMLQSWTEDMERKRNDLDTSELDLLKNLEPYNFTTTTESQRRKLTPGTCEWIAGEEEFQNWSPETNILWILGNPGSGKTYIAQWVCEHIRKGHGKNLMYFFFDAKSEEAKDLRSLNKFYQTILHQLLEGVRMTQPKLKTQCFKSVHNIILSGGYNEESYVKALREVLSLAYPSFLIVDALDECRDTELEVLKKWLETLRKLPKIQIVITSRSLQKTKKLCDNPIDNHLHLSSAVKRLDADIKLYITSRIENPDSEFPAEMSRVVEKLKARSSGMILYAKLMLDILENKVGTEDDFLVEMEKLPKTLTALYADRLNNARDKKFAGRMLQWLVTCRRPLTFDGLRGVDIIDRTVWPKECFDLDAENPPKELGKDRYGRDLFQIYLLRDLLPLVEVFEDKTVRLVHTTVSQFLMGEEVEDNGVQCPNAFRVDLDASHEHIAITCVTYLRWNFDRDGVPKSDSLAFLDNKDLHEYAVLEWPGHCEKSETKIMANEREMKTLMVFFRGVNVFSAWLTARAEMDSIFRAHFGLYGSKSVLPQPLHIAVFFNMWKFGRLFLEYTNINSRDATGSTALHIAAGRGYPLIVKELLELEARMDLADATGAYPLHRAVRRGNYETLGQLLAADMGRQVINFPDKYKFMPMHIACQLGLKRCVEILLQHNASLSNDSRAIETPIGLAIENGHIDIVSLLLEHEPSLVEHCRRPLIQSARRGSTDMVKFLCKANVDISYEDLLGQRALHKACIFGKTDLVEYLLSVDKESVNAKDKSQRTPLYFAAERGHIDVVNCLLQHNADQNSVDRRGETALFKPAGNGHIKVVDCLLKAGTDAGKLDMWQRTPLRFAAMKGHVGIVRMLLERTEIKQDIPDWVGRTVLHNAAAWLRKGQEQVIDLLFEYHAQPDTRDVDGWTALHASIGRQRDQPPPTDALLDRLIQNGVPIDAQDNCGRTALFLAAATGNLSAAKFLLGKGAAPGNLSLYMAVYLSRLDLVELFLDQGLKLDLSERDERGNTALHIAASKGNKSIVAALLGAGASTKCLNMDQQTPAGAVDKTKHPDIAKLFQEADSTSEGDLEARMTSLDNSSVNSQDELGRTLLHTAVLARRLDVVQQLLKAQANMEITDQIGRTPLHYAVQQVDPVITEALIAAKANVNAEDSQRKTPLYIAAEVGNIAETQMLLTAQAEFVASNDDRTPLHAAALGGYYQTAHALLEAERGRILISKQDTFNQTAIHLAAKLGHVDVVDKLLNYTQDMAVIDRRDDEERTALFLASEKGHFEVVLRLIQAGSIIYRIDKHRNMAIHLAAQNGHKKIVELLLDRLPAQIEVAMDKWRQCVPSWPTEDPYCEQSLLVALAKAGALVKDAEESPWRPDPSKWATSEELQTLQVAVVSGLRTFEDEKHSISSTTLMRAVMGEHADVVKLLLEKVPEMPLQAQHYSYSNVLSLAARRGFLEITRLLIAAKSEVNAITDSQETCLHEAAENGHGTVVELLLQNDANPDLARLRDGSSPLHLAAKGGHEAAVRALIRVAFINTVDDLGRTPLHVACLHNHNAVVDMLVDADADLAAYDIERRTPLELAKNLSDTVRAHMEEQATKQRQRRAAGH